MAENSGEVEFSTASTFFAAFAGVYSKCADVEIVIAQCWTGPHIHSNCSSSRPNDNVADEEKDFMLLYLRKQHAIVV